MLNNQCRRSRNGTPLGTNELSWVYLDIEPLADKRGTRVDDLPSFWRLNGYHAVLYNEEFTRSNRSCQG